MKLFSRKYIGSGSFLIGATILSNFINLAYNAFFGRYLSFEQFGLLTLTNTFLYISNIFFSAVSSTVNARTAFLVARFGHEAGASFYKRMVKRFTTITILFMVVWLVCSQLIDQFFHIPIIYPVLSFLPVFFFASFAAVGSGFLQGQFLFYFIGLFYLLEAIVKFLISVILLKIGLSSFVYIAIPGAVIASSIAVIITSNYVYRKIPKVSPHDYRFPKRFFLAAALTGFATNSFLTIDVLLTQHFFTALDAGIYAFLALIGKMIFFFGTLFNKFMIPFISRDEGARRDTTSHFRTIFFATVILTAIACTGLTVLGPIILPYIFGGKIQEIRSYLPAYALAISFYTIATVFNTYHLARKHYEYSAIAFLMTIFMSIGIYFNHASIIQVVQTILVVSIINVIGVSILHAIRQSGIVVFSNLIDLFRLFVPIEKHQKTKNGKSRILIFNWRDTKHRFAGGAELYVQELGKRWAKAGHTVTLFCGNDGKNPRYEVIDGIQVIRRGGFYMVYVWAYLYYIFRLRGKYDVIIDSENGIPFFTPLYARSEKIFLVMHHVHQEVFRKSLMIPLSWIATWLEIKLMPLVYRNTQYITVSASTRNDVINQNLTIIEPIIIHSGVNTKVYKPGVKSKHPLILYVGRLKFYKSLNVFIKTAQKLHSINPNIEFIIAGEGEEDTHLKQYAHQLNVPITFTGRISEKEKVRLYQSAWAVINPSSMEGWSITVIEANACGTLVIGSDVPGLRDSIRDGITGYLVSYGNADEFAKAVIKIVNKRAIRKELSKNAVNWSKQFSWEKSADLCLKIFGYEKTQFMYSKLFAQLKKKYI